MTCRAFQPRRAARSACPRPIRVYRVCAMPSPSSANAMLSILGLYERARPEPEAANECAGLGRLCVGEPALLCRPRPLHGRTTAIVTAPTTELIRPAYLDARAEADRPDQGRSHGAGGDASGRRAAQTAGPARPCRSMARRICRSSIMTAMPCR